MKKQILITLMILTPAAALADGFNWKGSCQGPNGMLVRIEPSDDDVRVTITQGRQGQMIVFDGSASSDILRESARQVTFHGDDQVRRTRVEMTIVRKEGMEPQTSRLYINNEPAVGLSNCSLKLANEQE